MLRQIVLALLIVSPSLAHAECTPASNSEIIDVREKLALELKDSESARFKQICKFTRILDRPSPGFTFCGLVNAKNSYGAYGGYVRFVVGKGGGLVDDGSTVFESFYCTGCSDPELSLQQCFARNIKMIERGDLPRKPSN